MKNFLLVVITLISSLLNAQNYTPFSGNKGWCIEQGALMGYWPVAFYYQKDTVINSATYGKYKFDLHPDIYLFREDAARRKVYRYNSVTGTEQLLYDYNFVTGDTITINFDHYPPVLFTVSKVDSVQVTGDWLRRIHFTHNDTGIESNFYWIEGAGSNWHPDYLENSCHPLMINNNRFFHLTCLYQDWQLVYIADTSYCTIYSESNCKGLLSTLPAEKEAVLVYPIPFTNHTTIEASAVLSFTITDITGRVITPLQTWSAGNQTLVLFDETLAPGNYILTTYLENGVSVQKLVKN